MFVFVLFVLVTCSAALNLRISVVTEDGQVSESLMEKAFARRVNSNWRVLQGHTLSYVHVNVSWCSSQQAVRTVCSESGLSALIGVGSCSLLDQVGSLSKSLQLPLIALPTGLCDSAQLLKDYTAVGSHSSDNMVGAAVSVITADSVVSDVVIFFDGHQSSTVVQSLQSGLTAAGVSSLTFQVDNTANASVTPSLVQHLKRLVKKRLFKLLLLASPRNALSVLRLASEAAVMQQNYFWLILDTGMSKADVLSVTPANANVALLRGSVFTHCTAAVMDVFPQCQLDSIRSLDARFVDAVEAVAKALNDSLMDPGFSPSNASCFPLQHWTSGSTVLSKLLSMSNYDTQRGLISYNSSSRHLSSQGVEVVASYNELRWSPISMLKSAEFDVSSGSLSKQFRYKGVSLAFPNTFMGFKNETLIVCAPPTSPMTDYVAQFPNKTVIIHGMTRDILEIVAAKMDFRFVTKAPDDGNWGAPQPGKPYFSGCVGEVQRGISDLGCGPFTKTSIRDSVVDFSTPLFDQSTAVLVPKPPPETKIWNVFTPLSPSVWFLLLGTVAFGSLFMWILARYSPFSAYNLRLEYAVADEIWLQEYIWSIIGSFLQQGQDFYPFAMSPRTVMAFWWMFTVVIFGAFTGDLTAHLTVTVTEHPIKTLSDLVSQSTVKPYIPGDTNVYTLLTMAQSGIYKELADSMVVMPPPEECPHDPPKKDAACINDYTFLLARAIRNCSLFYMLSETFNPATVAFVYPDDAAYAGLFDFYLQKMHESGLMQRLFNHYWSAENFTDCGKSGGGRSTEADSIDMEGVGGCFIVTGSLYCIGLFILLIELVWTKVGNKQPQECAIY